MKYLLTLSILISFSICTSTFAQIQDADGDNYYIEEGRTAHQALQLRTDLQTASAGDAIEGDLFGQARYTPDGSVVLIPHRSTNNISVFDALSFEIKNTIEVCEQPVGLDLTNEVVVVACFNANQVGIYSLLNNDELAVFPTDENPCQVVLSPDKTLALVATEGGTALLIDLVTYETTSIPDFNCSVEKFSFITYPNSFLDKDT